MPECISITLSLHELLFELCKLLHHFYVLSLHKFELAAEILIFANLLKIAAISFLKVASYLSVLLVHLVKSGLPFSRFVILLLQEALSF